MKISRKVVHKEIFVGLTNFGNYGKRSPFSFFRFNQQAFNIKQEELAPAGKSLYPFAASLNAEPYFLACLKKPPHRAGVAGWTVSYKHVNTPEHLPIYQYPNEFSDQQAF